MKQLSRLTSLLALGGIALLVIACSDDDRPQASGGAPSPQPTSTSPPGSQDAGPDALESCATSPQLGLVIEEQLLREASAPSPFGGQLLDGTYLLQDMFTYSSADAGSPDGGDPDERPPPPPIPTGNAGRTTLLVASGVLRFVGARGSTNALPADAVALMRYRASDAELKTESFCPADAPPRALGYSVVGNKLSLLVDANHREIYVRMDP